MATLIQERSTWWVASGGENPYEDGDYRYYWRISYEQSNTDKQNNQSQLIIDYYIQKHKSTSVYADVVPYPSGTSIVNIDGSEWGRFTTSSGNLVVGDSWTLSYIGTKKKAIPHNTDGSKSFTFQASGFGKGTSTSTYTLPKIDRGSVLGNIPTFNVDAGVTIPVTKYVTSYYDVLTVICKDTNDLTNTKTIKTYDNFSNNQKVEFTDSELNQIYAHQTKGSSTMISFELRTYTNSNKSTQIGGTSTKNVSASLTIVYPTMGSYNYADVNPVTLALTGNKPKYIVKGLSTLQISVPQEMESIANTRGSSIAYYLADETKIPYNTNGSSGTILNYSKDHIEVKAVDTRGDASGGLITWFEDEGAFIDYNSLSKNDNQTYYRSTDGVNSDGIGPFVNISFSGQWWQGDFGGTNNILSASYKFKKSDEQDYKNGSTELTLNTSTSNTFACEQFIAGDGNEGEFDISEIYDIIVIVKDSTGSSVEYTYSIHAGEPALALYKNKAALGAAYDEYLGGTQLWGTCYLNGEEIGNNLYPVGSIYLSVNDTDPSTLFGGEWEQIKDMFLLAAGDTYDAGSTGGSAEVTLTVDQMPKHNHVQSARNPADGTTNPAGGNLDNSDRVGSGVEYTTVSWQYANQEKWASGYTMNTYSRGGSKAHENMPPYMAVYVWKRIN